MGRQALPAARRPFETARQHQLCLLEPAQHNQLLFPRRPSRHAASAAWTQHSNRIERITRLSTLSGGGRRGMVPCYRRGAGQWRVQCPQSGGQVACAVLQLSIRWSQQVCSDNFADEGASEDTDSGVYIRVELDERGGCENICLPRDSTAAWPDSSHSAVAADRGQLVRQPSQCLQTCL